jgi:hypothetical protein
LTGPLGGELVIEGLKDEEKESGSKEMGEAKRMDW